MIDPTSLLKQRARALRGNATNAERLLWSQLRRKAIDGFRFRRQVPLKGFIADFVCLEAGLIVEVDGATHSTEEGVKRDRSREGVLKADGFESVRVTNDDVFNNLEDVLEAIRLKLLEPKPHAR